MIHRMSDLIGKPIVAADGGEKLGTVSDLLIDEATNGFVGLVVRHGGLMKREDVLPAAAVQAMGRDAIVSRSSADLIDGKEWKNRQRVSDLDR